eukprot:6185269-Pleurochrysis_carterae.AAC.3
MVKREQLIRPRLGLCHASKWLRATQATDGGMGKYYFAELSPYQQTASRGDPMPGEDSRCVHVQVVWAHNGPRVLAAALLGLGDLPYFGCAHKIPCCNGGCGAIDAAGVCAWRERVMRACVP